MNSRNFALPMDGVKTVYEIDDNTDIVAQYYPQFCLLGVEFSKPTVSGCKKLHSAFKEIINADVMGKYKYRGFGIVSDHLRFTAWLAKCLPEYKIIATGTMVGYEHVLVADLRKENK